MPRIVPDPTRFFDPGLGHPSTMRVELARVLDGRRENWRMTTRLAYRDRKLGDIVVPEPGGQGLTDLTSVPQLMTWLVPKTGLHLPAALVHDALTPPRAGTFELLTPPATPVTQIDADRVFRDAMADLGTPPVQRWLVWSAVSLPTVRTTGWWRAVLAYGSLGLIVVLGVLATLDLFDVTDLLPWMADRAWPSELILGLLFAIAIPTALSLLWPRQLRVAGLITGVALAGLLHVTLVVAAVYLGYRLVEAVATRVGVG